MSETTIDGQVPAAAALASPRRGAHEWRFVGVVVVVETAWIGALIYLSALLVH
jgi:hypothetical protein